MRFTLYRRLIILAVGIVCSTLLIIMISKISRAPARLKPILPTRHQPVVENRILVFKQKEKEGSLTIALESLQLQFTAVARSNYIPALVNSNLIGLFSVIVFEDMHIYLTLEKGVLSSLHDYCSDFGVGIIYFNPEIMPASQNQAVGNLLLKYRPAKIHNVEIPQTQKMLRLTRPGVQHAVELEHVSWVVFLPLHSTFETIAYGFSDDTDTKSPIIIMDNGEVDGIRRIFFGHHHDFWLSKIMFLDSLHFFTSGAIVPKKERFIQIDIDDMFIGAPGTKMNSSDAQTLYETQKLWQRNFVPGFQFLVGFSGHFYAKGLEEEQAGDRKMIELREHFRWFDHTFNHVQAHKYSDVSDLRHQMAQSKRFAEEHGIIVDPDYSVAPHHSGVFPVHDPLYNAWKDVWNIKVTSTEEYPHLRPSWHRKGFIYHDIMVLPRQTCGLFTKNLYYDEYPEGGPQRLEKSIRGGDLFDTILYNHINIYMTHQQNYAKDRLSLYTFGKSFQLFKNISTFNMRGLPPMELAREYFADHPEEREIIWFNPCDDHRHLDIWPSSKNCSKFPNLLLIGPQKTGTTALYQFLKVHPSVTANVDSPDSFEELQFFGTKNYYKGIEWYAQFFPISDEITFEKSATYFDHPSAPKQAFSLLPKARIIITLINPIDRAFSWYQHQKAHGHPVAISHSFHEVLNSIGNTSQRSLNSLKQRMIRPGFYFEHIQNWLRYYPFSQVLILDGELFKSEPVNIMKLVQKFLKVKHTLDYNNLLKFYPDKGFFCLTIHSHPQCLGKSKGRSQEYGKPDVESQIYLEKVFHTPNMYLLQFLRKHRLTVPTWLKNMQF